MSHVLTALAAALKQFAEDFDVVLNITIGVMMALVVAIIMFKFVLPAMLAFGG